MSANACAIGTCTRRSYPWCGEAGCTPVTSRILWFSAMRQASSEHCQHKTVRDPKQPSAIAASGQYEISESSRPTKASKDDGEQTQLTFPPPCMPC